jgi:hypothetical protein
VGFLSQFSAHAAFKTKAEANMTQRKFLITIPSIRKMKTAFILIDNSAETNALIDRSC